MLELPHSKYFLLNPGSLATLCLLGGYLLGGYIFCAMSLFRRRSEPPLRILYFLFGSLTTFVHFYLFLKACYGASSEGASLGWLRDRVPPTVFNATSVSLACWSCFSLVRELQSVSNLECINLGVLRGLHLLLGMIRKWLGLRFEASDLSLLWLSRDGFQTNWQFCALISRLFSSSKLIIRS